MSVETLCTDTCDIYESNPLDTSIGSYTIQSAIKYPDVKCRIMQRKSKEDITDGLEKENPSNYRIYIPDQLNILTTDYIKLNGIVYDILYVNKVYKRHMQIDVKRNSNQNIETNRYLIANTLNLKETFITQENGGLIIIEE